MSGKKLGTQGEEAAVRYLESRGYSIIDTNVRPFPGMRRGEIDIVAWHGAILCIVEVKTRASSHFDAADAVTVGKRRQLTLLAQAYVDRHRLQASECRFDVVCVYAASPGLPPAVHLIAGAFDPVY